jgi:coenzyme F420-reducing hydrogenase delta subunit
MAAGKTVITLICERAADLNSLLNENDALSELPDVRVVKFPCSGMIQPLMIEAALKAGAGGVIVCGCQIGDCFYREGNKMIRDRLTGERPPGLKKAVDRRRVMALWLSRRQKERFLTEAKEFALQMQKLDATDTSPKAAEPAAK